MKSVYKNTDITIPSHLNIVVALCSMSAATYFLWLASHTSSWSMVLLAMLGFGYFGNTIFGLLHEAVHSNFHHQRKFNYAFGNLFAAFFPTGFGLQRRCHLNHHRNNRTDLELFETYHEGDSKFLKAMVLYGVLTGIYWIFPFIGSICLLVCPSTFMAKKFAGKDNYKLSRLGGGSVLRNFENITKSSLNQMRLEILFMLSFQLSLFYLLDLTFTRWLLCYGTFALLWSSLQYTDHAYSSVDIRNGAWNLKVNPITKAFFLNYHDHLAHHQHPHVPWIHLPKFVPAEDPRPGFWGIYLRMWKGPIKVDRGAKLILDAELAGLIEKENFEA